MKLYIASSWRNKQYEGVLQRLRSCGHECYDFKNEASFSWSDINPRWTSDDDGRLAMGADLGNFRHQLLCHDLPDKAFSSDLAAMEWADACVMVCPCGSSAHMEAGWFVGKGKPVIILLAEEKFNPDLTWLMADCHCLSLDEVVSTLRAAENMQTEA